MKHWRITILLCFFFFLAATITCRLFYLQIISHKFYQSQALGEQAGFQEVQGDRGEIFSSNSKESHGASGSAEVKSLAINEGKWLVFAVPKQIKDKGAFAAAVANVMKESKKQVTAALEKSDSYVIIAKEVSKETVDALALLKSDGLYWQNVSTRYYPQEQFASQVIGFLGGNSKGQYGVEGYYDSVLAGKSGIKEEKRGLDAINHDDASYLNGSDLYLTIDYNIQFQAEALLREEKQKDNIDSGQIIVIKPDSGRILALANYPSFNLNGYSKEHSLEIFQNSAVQKIFEPGSVFKPFTMAMALNEGKVSPDTTFVDTGSATIGPNIVHNFANEHYGKSDMSRILEKSINTGAVFLSQLLSHDTFLSYLDKFGFNNTTGVDLQGEAYSRNEILKKGSPLGFATASFGQGIEMTPIQLLRGFCMFANGGRIVKPHLVEKIVHGQDTQAAKPEISDPVISEKTVSEVATMLINVVEKGFGDLAKIKGYYIAGKTGTAEVPFKYKKGYSDKTIQSFVGFGPALKPQFLILVKLDNPKVPKSSLSAAPVFKKMAQYIINYWQIPPDY